MTKEAPFDVWDGEELGLTDEVDEGAAEEVAMHLDPESEMGGEGGPHWSELTGGDDPAEQEAPVRYFSDEQPEGATTAITVDEDADEDTDLVVAEDVDDEVDDADEHEPDLEELLERQHYSFPD